MPKKRNPAQIYYKTAERNAFIEFTATTKEDKIIKFGYHTEADFIKAHKLSTDTIRRWKDNEQFWVSVSTYWRRQGRLKSPDVLKSLGKRAVAEGKAPESLAYLQVVGDYVPRQQVEDNTAKKSIESLQKDIQKLLEAEKKKLKK